MNAKDIEALSYRLPMQVIWKAGQAVPDCPRCGKTLMREGQRFCTHCGQKLAWGNTYLQ